MLPRVEFQDQPPEFWALVKLVSQLLGYSTRKKGTTPGRPKRYKADDVRAALVERGLQPRGHDDQIDAMVAYSAVRAELLEDVVEPNLMDRAQAKALFDSVKDDSRPAFLTVWNKQSGDKKHENYLASMVNWSTYDALQDRHGEHWQFDHAPRGPLTFTYDGMPLRTLFRWMDGAYPELNHPLATWEVKEYYGTKTFGSRVADGVYETALDGYELNDLRDVGVDVRHYLFVDDHFTWWDCGKSYLCRIIDMLHSDLLDGAFFGKEFQTEWPDTVRTWPDPPGFTS